MAPSSLFCTKTGGGESGQPLGALKALHDLQPPENINVTPKSFLPGNLLILLIIGVLSKGCEPAIMHVCDLEGETQLAKVPSQNDIRLTRLREGLSTPSKVTDISRQETVSRLKRNADFNEVYKDTARAEDDHGHNLPLP